MSETSTHYSRSPGPWVCEARNHAIADTGDVEGCLHITDAEGERVIEIWGDHDRDEANARLIAAAPDLLAALQAFHRAAKSWHDFHHGTDIACDLLCECIAPAAAAIEKATQP